MDGGSNPSGCVMNRKKLYNDVTSWTGWFFCEVAFKFYDLFDCDCLWSDKRDAYVLWFYPVAWFADKSYQLGSWFYDLEKD